MSFMLTIFMHLWLKFENRRRDRLAAEGAHPQPEDYTEEQRHAERERGDYARYVLNSIQAMRFN